jgi:hypothetical protein
MKLPVFWDIATNYKDARPNDGGSKRLWNVTKILWRDYKAQYPIRLSSLFWTANVALSWWELGKLQKPLGGLTGIQGKNRTLDIPNRNRIDNLWNSTFGSFRSLSHGPRHTAGDTLACEQVFTRSTSGGSITWHWSWTGCGGKQVGRVKWDDEQRAPCAYWRGPAVVANRTILILPGTESSCVSPHMPSLYRLGCEGSKQCPAGLVFIYVFTLLLTSPETCF